MDIDKYYKFYRKENWKNKSISYNYWGEEVIKEIGNDDKLMERCINQCINKSSLYKGRAQIGIMDFLTMTVTILLMLVTVCNNSNENYLNSLSELYLKITQVEQQGEATEDIINEYSKMLMDGNKIINDGVAVNLLMCVVILAVFTMIEFWGRDYNMKKHIYYEELKKILENQMKHRK